MVRMMLMSLQMWMRYVFTDCVSLLLYYGYQGLLDEGDSSMEEEESRSQVSVSVQCVVYCLVQVNAVNCAITIAEEKPATSGDKASLFVC